MKTEQRKPQIDVQTWRSELSLRPTSCCIGIQSGLYRMHVQLKLAVTCNEDVTPDKCWGLEAPERSDVGFYRSDVTWTDGRKEERDFFFFLKTDLFLSVLFVSFLLSPLLGAEMLRAEPSLCGNIGFTCLRHQLLKRECVHASVCVRAPLACGVRESMHTMKE